MHGTTFFSTYNSENVILQCFYCRVEKSMEIIDKEIMVSLEQKRLDSG